jgi:prepilin-type N-terminal cleavage/methylation domain-containing protein
MSEHQHQKSSSESGFSYIEVMVALVIFLIGILGYLSALMSGVVQSRGQQQQLAARHMVATAMESIMSAKETDPDRLGWKSIGNVGSNIDANGVPQGVFLTGFQIVLANAGADEVIGTADDAGAGNIGYSRQIEISDICDLDRPSPICAVPGTWPVRLRKVVVTVRYFVGSAEREESVTSILTDYAVTE